MKTLVVTRHPALVALLIERGIINTETPVLSHVTEDDVRDNHIIGVLPISLASLAHAMTEIPLNLSPEDRGKELDIERLREIAGEARTFQTREVFTSRSPRVRIGEQFQQFLRKSGLARSRN